MTDTKKHEIDVMTIRTTIFYQHYLLNNNNIYNSNRTNYLVIFAKDIELFYTALSIYILLK